MTNVISITLAVLSILGLIYQFAYRNAKHDSDVKAIKEELEKADLSNLKLMCSTLWQCYVVDPLHNRPELSQRQSPLKLTRAGMDIIPDKIKIQLDQIKITNHEDLVTGYLVVHKLGIDNIEQIAKEQKVSLQLMVAILSLYLDEKYRK